MKDVIYRYGRLFSFFVLAIFVLIQLSLVFLTAVNIPFWDEWETINLIDNLSIMKIFEYHNEHRVVLSKALYVIEYYINGLNFRYHSILNAFIVVAMVFALYKTISLWAKDFKFLPLFFIPYFTTIIFAGYYQDMTSTHMMLIFSCVSIYFGVYKERNMKNLILMLLFLFLSIISFSFTFALGVMVAFIVKLVIDIVDNRESIPRGIVILAIMIVGFFLIIYMPFFYTEKKLSSFELLYPNDIRFWAHAMKSLIFASTLYSIGNSYFIVIVLLVGCITSIILLPLFDREERAGSGIWVIYALIFGVCVSIGAISFGRGAIETMVADRHRQIVIILVPIVASILFYATRKYNSLIPKIILLVFSIWILFSIIYNLDYGRYFALERGRLQGVECVNKYYMGINDGNCSRLYPGNLSEKLDVAKRLNFSFTR